MNGLTHFVGVILSIAGTVLLMLRATDPLRPWHLAGYLVFSLSAVLLYASSTLFHWVNASKSTALALRKLDHAMIFVFIAATYTPFCLVPFRGTFGWTILSAVWTMAVLGSIVKVLWIHMPTRLCVGLYLFAGLFCVVGTGRILEVLPGRAVFWLVAGGVFYCVGAVFYVLDTRSCIRGFFGYHDVFHVLVLAGSAAHFWTVYRYVDMFA